MLCLKGKHVKALGKSSMWQGCSWGVNWILFPESSFFWLVLDLCILLVQGKCDLSCLFPQAEAEAAPVCPQHVADSSQEYLATLQQNR